MLRLTRSTFQRLDKAALRFYVELELLADGRDAVEFTPEDVEPSPRSLRRLNSALRTEGLTITFNRRSGRYRVEWPNHVDIPEFLARLETYQAGQDYPLTQDMLRSLRDQFPDMPADRFRAATETALISAHVAGIRASALQRWLYQGVQYSYKHMTTEGATPETDTNDTDANANAKDTTWDEHVEQVIANRPDPRRLYGNNLPPGMA